jgi:hypothetical protein
MNKEKPIINIGTKIIANLLRKGRRGRDFMQGRAPD